MSHPSITLHPKEDKRVRAGHPWIYSNELVMDAAAKAIPAGTVVRVNDARGNFLALAHYNPHTLIAARVLARMDTEIDVEFWQTRLARALRLREKLFSIPHYRLVHAEADELPGLIIDRYGDHLVVQANTSGMNAALPHIAEALNKLLNPHSIILRGDNASRTLEGLKEEVTMVKGEAHQRLIAHENGLDYVVDAMGGQKTGWFYDQRRNRKLIADLAKGKSVVDMFSHTGGFGLLAAKQGAAEVVCVDSSEHALSLAKETAAANKLSNVNFEREDVFEFCAANKSRKFDMVLADPPAFAKSRKDVPNAARGYRKLARMAAQLAAEDGLLLVTSCSHAITRERFNEEIIAGVVEAHKTPVILAETQGDLDHPTHSRLPESAYLKGILLRC